MCGSGSSGSSIGARRGGAARGKNSENRGDLLMVAHRAQLRDQRSAVCCRPRTAADGGEKTALRFLLGENDVLIALMEMVAAISIIATGKNVDLRGIRTCELFTNFKMIAGYRKGVGCWRGCLGGGGVCRLGFNSCWGGNVFNVRDGSDEDDVIGLQSWANSGRSFRTRAGNRGDRPKK